MHPQRPANTWPAGGGATGVAKERHGAPGLLMANCPAALSPSDLIPTKGRSGRRASSLNRTAAPPAGGPPATLHGRTTAGFGRGLTQHQPSGWGRPPAGPLLALAAWAAAWPWRHGYTASAAVCKFAPREECCTGQLPPATATAASRCLGQAPIGVAPSQHPARHKDARNLGPRAKHNMQYSTSAE